MKDIRQKMMDRLGLTEADFCPKPRPDERIEQVEKRTDALETATDDMILLMAELIGG